MAQGVKDLALALLWLGSLLWYRSDCWPRNFRMSWMQPKKKSKVNLLFKRNKRNLILSPRFTEESPVVLRSTVAEGGE